MSQSPNPYAPPQTPGGMIPPGSEQFAPCPQCQNTYAKKVGFTWWGGALGPRLFSHVKCLQCGTCYNGKTGESNNTKIVIYLVVSFVIGIAIAAALFMSGAW